MAKPEKETVKSERFVRVAEARVNKLIKMIRLLGNCSSPGTYKYTPAQVNQIFTTLADELASARKSFSDASASRKRFSLSDKPEHHATYEDAPHVLLALPDGSKLAAAAMDDGSAHPSILVYWTHVMGDETVDDLVCCAEYTAVNEVSAIAYKDSQEDPVYFESFHDIGREGV